MRRRQPTKRRNLLTNFFTYNLLLTLFIFTSSEAFSQNILFDRTIGQTEHCNGVTVYSFYLNLDNATSEEKLYQIQNGSMVEYDDGTARLTGTAINNVHPTQTWDFDVVLAGRTFNAPANSPKDHNCQPTITDDWYYYTSISGSFLGGGDFAGAEISVSRRGPAFQMGTGANVQEINSKFDGCGWHFLDFVSQPDNGTTIDGTDGDFNMSVSGAPMTEDQSCGGSISNFTLTNGPEDLILSDGGTYTVSELPTGAELLAEVNGPHGSLKFDVSGTLNTQNILPYSFSWNPTPGTYTIYAQLFSENNLEGTSCDDELITITIVPGPVTPPTMIVSLGDDQQFCEGDIITLSPNVGNQSECELFCAANGMELIAQYDMNDCAAFSNDNSTYEYTEFDAATNALNCAEISTSKIYRFQGKHSCTDDHATQNSGDAVCVGMPDINSFVGNHLKSVRFDVTVDPTNGHAGLTGLSFRELAPEDYLWSAEGLPNNTGTNNYPTKFGIRVLKSGVEVFRMEDIPTSQVWETQSFDFAGLNDFTVSEITTFTVELLAYDLVGNGSGVAAWDIDDLKIFGGCCTPTVVNDLSYAWSDGSTGESLDISTAGTYLVTVTDCAGLTAEDEITVTSTAINGVLTATNVTCQNGTDGTIMTTINEGQAPFSYLWNNGTTTENLTAVAAGIYTVTITDANGCAYTDNIEITQPEQIVAIASITDLNCTGDQSGAIDLTVSGGTLPYTLNWDNGATTEDLSGLPAGGYNIDIVDDNGCSLSLDYTVTEPTALEITGAANPVVCAGDENGSINISVTGGTESYQYLWSNGATEDNQTGLAAGTYTVTVFDNNNCQNSMAFTIEEPMALTSNINVTEEVACADGNNASLEVITTGGTGNYFYQWSNGAMTSSLFGLAAGTYEVTVSDENQCTITQTVTLTAPEAINVNIDLVENVTCNGEQNGRIEITTTGGVSPYSFIWNNGATTENIEGLSAGTYSLTVSDNNGCSTEISATISEPTALAIVEGDIVNVNCEGAATGDIYLILEGGTTPYTFSWSDGSTNQNLNNVVAGDHSVTVTDAAGCTVTETYTINDGDVFAIENFDYSASVSCAGSTDGFASFMVTAGQSIDEVIWSNGSTEESLVNLSAGTYSVTVTSFNGCIAIDSIEITEPPVLDAQANSTNEVSCHDSQDGVAEITATGGTAPYAYNWSNGTTETVATDLSADTYSYTVTDDNNCQTTGTITLTAPEAVVIELIEKTDVTCNGGNEGSIVVATNGGTAPLNYQWSNGETSQDLNNLVAGTYTLSVIDANGCSNELTIIIEEPTLLSATIEVTNVPCFGEQNGTATSTITGGTAPYTFNWSNGADTQNLADLAAENYTGTITDSNNCTIEVDFAITQPEAIEVTIETVMPTCNAGSEGSINITATGGTGTLNYLWNNGATTANIENLAAGIYTVTITDENECTSETSVEIVDPVALSLTANTNNIDCAGNENGLINLSVAGGTAPYQYNWSNGATTESIDNLAAGTYAITVSDANGCSANAAYEITEPVALTATTEVTDVRCHGGDDGLIKVFANGGSTPYAYQWSNGNNLAINDDVTAGTYSVTIYDANQCSFITSVTVNEPTALNPFLYYNTDVDCFEGNNGAIDAGANGGVAPYTYQWSNGATTSAIENLVAGVYEVTVTDANNCVQTLSTTIEQPEDIEINVFNIKSPKCFGGMDGSARVFVEGGNSPYVINWDNGQSGTTVVSLEAGIHSLTVTDASGCMKAGSFEVMEPLLLKTEGTVTNTLCADSNDGTITLSPYGGTAPYSASWSNGLNGLSIANLAAGTYTATVTDDNGCSIEVTYEVTSPMPITSNPLVTGETCAYPGSIDVEFTGGTAPYTYLWSNGATTESIADLTADLYMVTITDANDCVSTFGYNVPGYQELNLGNVSNIPVRCNGANTGSISTNVNGGFAPYTYTWSNGVSEANITDLTAGIYSLTVTDTEGCIVEESFEVGQTDAITGSIEIVAPVSAPGMSDAILEAAIDGGFPDYTYLWNTGATTMTIENVPAGDYTLTVTDQFDCSESFMVTVAEGIDCSNVSAIMNLDRSFCQEFAATFSAEDMGDSTQYDWAFYDGPDSNSPFAGTASGIQVDFSFVNAGEKSVQLTVTTANGCTKSVEEAITVSENVIDGGIIGEDESNCMVYTGETIQNIELPGTGAGEYDYLWMYSYSNIAPTGIDDRNWVLIEDATSESYEPGEITVSTYFVRFSKGTGCNEFLASSNIVAKELNDPGITADFEVDQAICLDTEISFLATDAGRNATYNWNFFNGNSSRGSYLGSRSGQLSTFTFTNSGEVFVQLLIELPSGCILSKDSVLVVEEAGSSACQSENSLVTITEFGIMIDRSDNTVTFWTIEDEVADVQYEIERSSDNGRSFDIIGAVSGDLSGSYLFTDPAPLTGISHYQLKVTHPTGELLFSEVAVHQIEGEIEGYTYPNPATTSTFLRLNEPLVTDTQMELTDNVGNIIETKLVAAGTSEIFWDLSRLPDGQYYIYSIVQGRRTLISDVMKFNR